MVWKKKFEDDIKVVAWSPDGDTIASVLENTGGIIFWTLETKKAVAEFMVEKGLD